jgi:hypothetical protein
VFYCIKSILVSCLPPWNFFITFLACEFIQYDSVVGHFGEESGKIAYEAQRTADVAGSFWNGPGFNVVCFSLVRLNAVCGNLTTEEMNLRAE